MTEEPLRPPPLHSATLAQWSGKKSRDFATVTDQRGGEAKSGSTLTKAAKLDNGLAINLYVSRNLIWVMGDVEAAMEAMEAAMEAAAATERF